jgi:hypothetical protein
MPRKEISLKDQNLQARLHEALTASGDQLPDVLRVLDQCEMKLTIDQTTFSSYKLGRIHSTDRATFEALLAYVEHVESELKRSGPDAEAPMDRAPEFGAGLEPLLGPRQGAWVDAQIARVQTLAGPVSEHEVELARLLARVLRLEI